MEDKEPEDDLFDRLNVSHRFHQSVIYCLEYKNTYVVLIQGIQLM